MTPKQFVDEYNMHDSLIDSISIEEKGKTIRMVFDFAFWMQKNYQENFPETGPLEVCFMNTEEYNCPDHLPLEEVSILNVSLQNGKVIFALLNDVTDEYYEINIMAESVYASKNI